MTVRELFVSLGFKVDENSANKAEKKIKDVKNQSEELAGSMNDLGPTLKKLGGIIAAVFSVNAIKNFASECVQLASDVEQTNQKFEAVFGSISYEVPAAEFANTKGQYSDLSMSVQDWAEQQADAWGRSKNTIKTYLADEQNMLYGLGSSYFQSEEEARAWSANLSEEMTGLAMDLASFANLDEDSAINAMTKAVMGQTEAARTLGAVLDDNSRKLAMNELGLSGTYDKLDQVSKMQVNYKAIVMQSTDAIGDMNLSMENGLFESKARMATASMEELKETIGVGLMPLFTAFQGITYDVAHGLNKVSEAIFFDEKGESRLQKATTILNEKWNQLQIVLKKVQGRFKENKKYLDFIIKKLGGMSNALKLLAISAAAVAIAMNFDKAVKGITKLSKAFKALGTSGLKIAAIALIIIALALVIEDFVGFMQGKESVIGSILEKYGVDTEKVKSTVIKGVDGMKKAFSGLAGWFNSNESLFTDLFDSIVNFASYWGPILTDMFISYIRAVVGFFKRHSSEVNQTIKLIKNMVNALLKIIVNVVKLITAIFNGDLRGAWEAVKGIFQGAIEYITNCLQAWWIWIKAILSEIKNLAISIVKAIATAVINRTIKMVSKVISRLAKIGKYLKDLKTKAVTWGKDFIQGLIDGITGKIKDVKKAVKKVAKAIKDKLHFSRPEDGPLRDYETWMPDFMQGLASGITDNKDKISSAITDVSESIAVLASNATASAKTAAVGSVSNKTSNVTQNVNIDNTYNGTPSQAAKSINKTMNKSANDATTQMARALQFARG